MKPTPRHERRQHDRRDSEWDYPDNMWLWVVVGILTVMAACGAAIRIAGG